MEAFIAHVRGSLGVFDSSELPPEGRKVFDAFVAGLKGEGSEGGNNPPPAGSTGQ
ncbi:MAG: hypothetical protein US80_C0001G0018 [Candidatus Daviesbacteria bacterium GW2011_GWA2_38_17]|nr:MAG: hypothetical protein US80_C0001G0018 [Candidatus Daviesbacteria bacterium GW2011_GWA2_38_17]